MDISSESNPGLDTLSLRKIVLLKAGQDVRRCRDCALCNGNLNHPEITESMDISLDTLVHMVLWNDDEVLSSKTVWSEPVYQSLLHACVQGLNLQAIVSILRNEARLRGNL